MSAERPLLLVFCGPNGAGKSTLRRLTLADLPEIPFINADDIGLELFGPEEALSRAYEAAERAEALRQACLVEGGNFSFETVMSHESKVDFIRQAQAAGYEVFVHFVGLASAEHSRARVIQRVNSGGHDVPDEKITARFPRVIQNLGRLLDLPDELVILDNTSDADPFRRIARLEKGRLTHLAAEVPAWLTPLDLERRRTPETLCLP